MGWASTITAVSTETARYPNRRPLLSSICRIVGSRRRLAHPPDRPQPRDESLELHHRVPLHLHARVRSIRDAVLRRLRDHRDRCIRLRLRVERVEAQPRAYGVRHRPPDDARSLPQMRSFEALRERRYFFGFFAGRFVAFDVFRAEGFSFVAVAGRSSAGVCSAATEALYFRRSRDFRRPALFECSTPFCAARSRVLSAFLTASREASMSPPTIASLACLIAVFVALFTARLRRRLFID